MLPSLQMKGLFRRQSHKYVNNYHKNLIFICKLFDSANILQESIHFRLFPFSLMGEAVIWLRELPEGSITLRVEFMKAFLIGSFLCRGCLNLGMKSLFLSNCVDSFFIRHGLHLRKYFYKALIMSYQKSYFYRSSTSHWIL